MAAAPQTWTAYVGAVVVALGMGTVTTASVMRNLGYQDIDAGKLEACQIVLKDRTASLEETRALLVAATPYLRSE